MYAAVSQRRGIIDLGSGQFERKSVTGQNGKQGHRAVLRAGRRRSHYADPVLRYRHAVGLGSIVLLADQRHTSASLADVDALTPQHLSEYLQLAGKRFVTFQRYDAIHLQRLGATRQAYRLYARNNVVNTRHPGRFQKFIARVDTLAVGIIRYLRSHLPMVGLGIVQPHSYRCFMESFSRGGHYVWILREEGFLMYIPTGKIDVCLAAGRDRRRFIGCDNAVMCSAYLHRVVSRRPGRIDWIAAEIERPGGADRIGRIVDKSEVVQSVAVRVGIPDFPIQRHLSGGLHADGKRSGGKHYNQFLHLSIHFLQK